MGKLVLHNLDRSRSYRVIWLLEELGVQAEIKQYSRDGKGPNPAAKGYTVHPLGKFPLIETEDGEMIAETGAIFEYLLRKYDSSNKLSGSPGTRDDEKINYWFHYAEVKKFDAPQKLVDEVKSNLKYVNGELGKHSWIAGDKFTAADVCMEFPVEFTELLPDISLSDYPKIQAWQKKIKQRDAYKKAMDKNGDYDLKSLLKMF